jgi:hypothetical protein
MDEHYEVGTFALPFQRRLRNSDGSTARRWICGSAARN